MPSPPAVAPAVESDPPSQSPALDSSVLVLTDVHKSYLEPNGERLPILDIERFAIAAGEQIVLRGRSGSGKTTLLNCIAGLTTVDRGRIEVNGRDVVAMPEAIRDRYRASHIGFVFQTFNLLPAFTALENVMLGMTFTGGRPDAAWARQLLADVGLGHRLTHKPRALSVGEQQRVAVARALANRPVLLLADEPTANVDPAHQRQVIDLLRAACLREQVAMLLVTHSPEVSQQFDRVEQLEALNRAAVVA
jgi:ABC-type lipoprotein export system ATPase subunit